MSEALPIWSCEFKELEDGHPMNNLTVGSKFKVNCHGDIPVTWDKNALDVRFPTKDDAYTLAILQTDKLEANTVELLVTGYKAGQFKPEYIRIVQGEHGFEVSKPAWEIRTVLKKEEQQPQPYPAFGPWGLGLPIWFMIVIGLLVGIITYFIVRVVRRRAQRQRMLNDLARHKTALTPVNQFYRDARVLRKRINNSKTPDDLKTIAVDLDHEFRLYVLRQFLVPALEWSDGDIVGDIRKRHRRVFEEGGDALRKALRELTRIKSQKSVSVPDIEQLHYMSLEAVEKVETARESKA